MLILLFSFFFLALQLVLAFCVYRVVIRPLPTKINELVFQKHLDNDFSKVPREVSEVYRARLLELEEERIDAIARYAMVKGLKNLNTTQRAERDGLRKAIDSLKKQIDEVKKQYSQIFGSDSVVLLENFEQLKPVKRINAYLDRRQQKSE